MGASRESATALHRKHRLPQGHRRLPRRSISAGTSPFDSGLLTASADAKDVFFFTRDSLAPQDKNGPTMKIYDAREGGGFPFTSRPSPARPPTSATAPAAPPRRRSKSGAESGTPHNYPKPNSKACTKDRSAATATASNASLITTSTTSMPTASGESTGASQPDSSRGSEAEAFIITSAELRS